MNAAMSRAQWRECNCMTQLPIVGEAAAACQIGSQSGLIAGLHVEPVEPANRRGTFSLISLG